MKTMATCLLILSLSYFLSACQGAQSEKDMIAEAQYCLDGATDSSSADACLTKISSLNSKDANTLRCAGGFISAQITSPSNLSSALNSISDGQGASGLLTALSFPSVSLANTTFDYCNKSSQAGLKLIGAMAKSATLLTSASRSLGLSSCAVITECSASDLKSGLQTLITRIGSDSSANDTVLGVVTAIQTVYTSTCAGGTTINSDICGQIKTAVSASGKDITTTNQTELLNIGRELLAQWKNN